MSSFNNLMERALMEMEACPQTPEGDARVLEILESVSRVAKRFPKPPKPATAVNRSAQRRLEQLGLAPKRG